MGAFCELYTRLYTVRWAWFGVCAVDLIVALPRSIVRLMSQNVNSIQYPRLAFSRGHERMSDRAIFVFGTSASGIVQSSM